MRYVVVVKCLSDVNRHYFGTYENANLYKQSVDLYHKNHYYYDAESYLYPVDENGQLCFDIGEDYEN